MGSTTVGRFPLSPTYVFTPKSASPFTIERKAGEKQSLCGEAAANYHRSMTMGVTTAAAALPGRGGVLEKPITEKTTPSRESDSDLRKSQKMSPPYRVILHNDDFNRSEYVVQVLMRVIPGMIIHNAVNIMQEAHYNGLSIVIICAQAEAEDHCAHLRGNGLFCSIEPATGNGGGGGQR